MPRPRNSGTASCSRSVRRTTVLSAPNTYGITAAEPAECTPAQSIVALSWHTTHRTWAQHPQHHVRQLANWAQRMILPEPPSLDLPNSYSELEASGESYQTLSGILEFRQHIEDENRTSSGETPNLATYCAISARFGDNSFGPKRKVLCCQISFQVTDENSLRSRLCLASVALKEAKHFVWKGENGRHAQSNH